MACIEKGIAPLQATLDQVKTYVVDLSLIYGTLDADTGSIDDRRDDFDEIMGELQTKSTPIHKHMAGVMARFAPGLFVDCGKDDGPNDNLDLERWFRRPKGHERRIHGHAHAGVRIVQEGPTLMLTLDAHTRHPTAFTADDLIPYRRALPPPCQTEAVSRRKIMRRARSRKQRAPLLADLEQRYYRILGS